MVLYGVYDDFTSQSVPKDYLIDLKVNIINIPGVELFHIFSRHITLSIWVEHS